jgi:hypothetical protein
MNIGIVKQVISDHKEWKVNNRANDSVGLAYDGCSSFYSTALLPLPYTTDGRTATVDVTYTPKLQTIISLRFLWWKIGKLKFSRTKENLFFFFFTVSNLLLLLLLQMLGEKEQTKLLYKSWTLPRTI